MTVRFLDALCRIAILLCACATRAHGAEDAASSEFFEKRIRPTLVDRCYSCHSAKAEKLKGGLHLDSRAGMLRGGDSGPSLVAGQPGESLLIEAVRYQNVDLQMPPKGRLDEGQIADLTAWVAAGAPWPDAPTGSPTAAVASAPDTFDLQQRRNTHWAWRPLDTPAVPAPNPGTPARHPIDAFLLARLEAAGLRPAPQADPRTLLRRLSLDLVGLPPAPADLDAFERDPSPSAWVRQVDRFLASPQFGERWARHWLDLARYAETLGHEFDYTLPNAWRYRDYVIRALNADLPYDRFAREQIAGDLLPDPRIDPRTGLNESLTGTALFWLGQRVHSPVDLRQDQADAIENQIDVITKTFLGLTVACARCHDHKFDAISTRDYYSLYGTFSSSRYAQRSIEPIAAAAAMLRTVQARRSELETAAAGAHPPGRTAPPTALLSQPADPAGSASGSKGRVFADFAAHGYEGWFSEGAAFGAGPAPAGTLIALASNRLATLTRPAAHSAAVSRRLQGILFSPTFTLTNRYIHVRAAGRSSRINVVMENFFLIRDPIYGGLKRKLNSDAFRWITFDVGMWSGRQAYLEFSDITSPDLADDSPGFAPDGYLAVERVVLSDEKVPPPEPADESPDWIEAPAAGPLARALEAFQSSERAIADPLRVPAMIDGTPLDEPVFIRGNPRNPGPRVPRRFLEALGGEQAPYGSNGSGRLQLSEDIADPQNPFFSRVFVNRVWHHLFGRGLVPTPDDFGVLGQPPSHPELLDWLAGWVRAEGGWSLKRLVRMLVLSEAYRRSSRPADTMAEEKDPGNVLLHRMNLRRLEGEIIRDSLLAVSGRLDPEQFGPAVTVHLTSFMDGRGRPGKSGPLDGAGRRSIYLEVRRNFLPPMMRAFDTPVPFTTVGRRTASNVPAQSLMLMNDPFVIDQAGRWARRLLESPADETEARIARAYREALGRTPTPAETERMRAFVETQAGALGVPATDPRVWTDLCHVLFNTKEFIYNH